VILLQHEEKTQNILSKALPSFDDICCLNSYLLHKKRAAAFPGWNFKITYTKDIPLGRPPETAPPSRMNAPHYPSYTAANVKAKSTSALYYVLTKGQCCETRHNCENCRMGSCAALFPTLPYGG
jgi:hypothetical protein